MNRRCLTLVLLFFLPIVLSAQTHVKIMTYNVRNCIGLDNVCNYDRIADIINRERPDVIAIQEVDSATVRSGGKYVLGELATRTGMMPYFSPAIDYDNGKYGVGILSQKAPIKIRKLSLPGSEEQRTLILAEYDDYIFCCTHLSLTETDRNSSAVIINGLAEISEKPIFIAGDFNSEPESAVHDILKHHYQTLSDSHTPTYPADKPSEILDYIMVTNNRNVTADSSVLNEPEASDHRPIVVNAIIKHNHNEQH